MVQIEESEIKNGKNNWLKGDLDLCSPIPPNTPHAISVSLPKWKDNVDYEEGNPRVINKMKSGYPRFCIHESVLKLNEQIAKIFGITDQLCYTFPSRRVVEECKSYLYSQANKEQLILLESSNIAEYIIQACTYENLPKVKLSILFFSNGLQPLVKSFWQHTGEIISSRLAEHCLKCISKLNSPTTIIFPKRNNRYQKLNKQDIDINEDENLIFIEERFGRNLSIKHVEDAKLSMKKRLNFKQQLNKNLINQKDFQNEIENVFLYPTGMAAIYNAHKLALKMKGDLKSVCFGFPYTDTLKILEKFGKGCHFLGHGDNNDIIKLEEILKKESIAALFCEFPSNPLLKSANLSKLRQLADQYNFLIVIDDTLGSLININVDNIADIMVSSLTKIFSGESNVMGGSLILSSQSKYYLTLKQNINMIHEDLLWCEDTIFLERNSRTFEERVKLINSYTETLCDLLIQHSKVKTIHYPKYSTPRNYLKYKTQLGGYGGLFSIEFLKPEDAIEFYDNLNVAKGPSLGTNFTLVCPYTLLAHYNELDWAQSFNVSSNLIRVAVGLEGSQWLKQTFLDALNKI